jgi:hypothetical protein
MNNTRRESADHDGCTQQPPRVNCLSDGVGVEVGLGVAVAVGMGVALAVTVGVCVRSAVAVRATVGMGAGAA